MAKIIYVGKKPMKTDNVAGTDTVWNGHGDVQDVADSLAVEKLIAHSDIWRLVAGETKPSAGLVAKLQKAERVKAQKARETEEVEEPAARVDVSKMGKDRLQQYARAHFGVQLDQRHSLPKMREAVQKLVGKDAQVSRNVTKRK